MRSPSVSVKRPLVRPRESVRMRTILRRLASASLALVKAAPMKQVALLATVYVGSPAEATAQQGCHASYEGACVPISSDVDCAGGSGNGPEYVRGPVYVVGPDVYDLDRDGDGVACE